MKDGARLDLHGDRMKGYELAAETSLAPLLPIYARLDGRSFSRFTRGMARPFDPAMAEAMIVTAAGLVDRTHARIGYTQSDEISLVFLAEGEESELWFGGRVQKLASVLASLGTALFTARLMAEPALEPYRERLPHFDCRVCQLPSKAEAANMLVWRYKDGTKNAIQAAAQAVFSPKKIHGKNSKAMLEMLAAEGVDFSTYPGYFRFGTFLRRQRVLRKLRPEEFARIPERHQPVGPVERIEIERIVCEDFLGLPDREAFVFGSREDQR